MRRLRLLPLWLFLSLATFLGGLAVEPVQAGCCLILSVDELPRTIVADRPVTMSYTARLTNHLAETTGHFQETFIFVHAETGEQLAVEAVPVEGEPGRFQATLIFPTAGQWQWQLGGRPMPPIVVQLPVAQAAATPSLPAFDAPLLAGAGGLLAAAVALFFWIRQRTRYRLAWVALAVMVAAGGFTLRAVATPEAALAERETAMPAIAPEAMGEALFVAKGCVTCHRHDGVAASRESIGIGPTLTAYQGDPDFLRQWLRNPRAVRPNTFMPNLGLSDAEIETLVAFLSAEGE